VTLKKVESVLSVPGAEMLAISGKSIITLATVDSRTTDIALNAFDLSGKLLWQKLIDSGADEIAMATAVDGAGNIWITGFSSKVNTVVTESTTAAAENPDAISIEPALPIRGDLNNLSVWKIAVTGEVSAAYQYPLETPGLINSISVTNSGISIVGTLAEKPFLQNMTASGVFSKPFALGSSKTTINAVVRNSDGTSSLFGSSTESLGGKKLAGVRDGVLIKVAKSGSLLTVVRSSAIKGDRSWLTADSNLLLSGYVKIGKTTETAITKFSGTFTPSWTIRLVSSGQSRALVAGGTSYAALGSKSALANITGWKPSKVALLVVGLDAKGVITSAFGSNELGDPLALAYSKDVGLVGLALNGDQIPVIFRIASR
jgi:hypothetical protein